MVFIASPSSWSRSSIRVFSPKSGISAISPLCMWVNFQINIWGRTFSISLMAILLPIFSLIGERFLFRVSNCHTTVQSSTRIMLNLNTSRHHQHICADHHQSNDD